MSNVFIKSTRRSLTIDILGGRTSHDYVCDLMSGDTIVTSETLSNMFGYFKSIRVCHSKLRYFDCNGQVHLAKDKTGGQEGDPLEMLIFNLTIHHVWGRVLTKFSEARAVAYADDGYIKGKLSVTFQVLTEVKRVLKEDTGLDLHVVTTSLRSSSSSLSLM